MKIEDCRLLLPGRRVGAGDIEIADGRIRRIDEHECPARRVVLPGLVNCHGHTPMTLVRGVGGGLPLRRWLDEAIFPIEAKMRPEDIAAGMRWGVMEMLAGGTTCVADMYDFPGEEERVLRETGLKGRVCRVGLEFVPGRLADCIAFVRGDGGGDVRRDFCLHSEYLTNEAFCRGLVTANRELGRPVHVHVSETRREHEECLGRHGKTPMRYLADLGVFDHGGYAAHCVWCTDDDFRLMAERNVTLVHNPTSNMKLGSGFAPITRARELGVNVALGTDGCASNDNLDMFEEMHLAALLPKGLACDPTLLSAWDVIEMATVNGARALGLGDSGELREGFAADLCVVELDRPHLRPAHDIPNLVVYSMQASDVTQTIVGGRVLYDHGTFTTIDAEAAREVFDESVRHCHAK